MANLGTKAGVEGRAFRIRAPLLRMTKAEIVRGQPRSASTSRSRPPATSPDLQDEPCGACDACLLREKGFREAGLNDPARRP